MNIEEAMEFLGMAELTIEEFRAKSLNVIKLTHPDKGGTKEEFLRAIQARKVVEKALKTCQHCAGKGYTVLRRSFNTITKSCAVCRGTGENR